MPDYLRFHVRLLGVPAHATLWRRFLIKKTATFADLHQAIQDACGWENCHLYAFRTPDQREVIASLADDEWGPPEPDAGKVKLSNVFGATPSARGSATVSTPHQTCIYHYDFGDDWYHEVTFEGVEQHTGRFARRLLDGAGTFPPEDSGGPHGYLRCVAVATGQGWTDEFGSQVLRKEIAEWLGEWRPDQFVLERAKEEFER